MAKLPTDEEIKNLVRAKYPDHFLRRRGCSKSRENYLAHKRLFGYRDPKSSEKCHRKWYESEVRSIEQMANEVGLKDHYDGLYRPLSGIEPSDAVAYFGMIPTDLKGSETPKINLYVDMFEKTVPR